jgi:type III secretion protein Q
MSPTPVATAGAPPFVRPLGPELQSVSPFAARVSRIAFDTRFQRWIRAVFPQQDLKVYRGRVSDGSTLLRIETGEGGFHLSVNTSEWPALEMALAMADEASACAVATVLLEPWIRSVAPLMSAARVVARRKHPESAALDAAAMIATSQARVAVQRVDEALDGHLKQALAAVAADALRTLGDLLLHGRLCLMERDLPLRALRALDAGDTVLFPNADAAPNTYRLIFGRGVVMQVNTQLDPESDALVATGAPTKHAERTGSDILDGRPGPIDDLQLPISFEVDTARISLNELASIRPGYVIELDRPLTAATVRLVCNGQTVGHGQLVAVGEQMGVRILRMGLINDAVHQR